MIGFGTHIGVALVKTRWGILIFSLFLFGIAGLVLAVSSPVHMYRVSGTVAAYREVSVAPSKTQHELTLDGDARTFIVAVEDFSQHGFPAAITPGTPVGLWVDHGRTEYVIAAALQTADVAARPTFTTARYEHPEDVQRNDLIAAGIFALGGLICLAIGLTWKRWPWAKPVRSTYTPTYMPTYMTAPPSPLRHSLPPLPPMPGLDSTLDGSNPHAAPARNPHERR